MYLVSIDLDQIPREEHDKVRQITTNLALLNECCNEFLHVYKLFQYALGQKRSGLSERSQMIAWMRTAGRSGAMIAYNVLQIMQATDAINAPTIRLKADFSKRKTARRLFEQEFPDISAARHTVAHSADFAASANKTDEHRLKKAVVNEMGFFGAGTYLGDSVHAEDDRLLYKASYEGREARYELSIGKHQVLTTVAGLYNETFYQLEHPSIAAMRNSMDEN